MGDESSQLLYRIIDHEHPRQRNDEQHQQRVKSQYRMQVPIQALPIFGPEIDPYRLLKEFLLLRPPQDKTADAQGKKDQHIDLYDVGSDITHLAMRWIIEDG